MLLYCQLNYWKQLSVKYESNTIIFIQWKEFENVVFKSATILYRPQSVTHFYPGAYTLVYKCGKPDIFAYRQICCMGIFTNSYQTLPGIQKSYAELSVCRDDDHVTWSTDVLKVKPGVTGSDYADIICTSDLHFRINSTYREPFITVTRLKVLNLTFQSVW